MVLVATDGGMCPLLEHGIEGRVGQVLVAEAEGHLVDDVEAQRVGQFVEARLARIVRRADIVDGGLLHQSHVAQDAGLTDDLHRRRVGAVRGDATQFDGPSVEFQDVPLDGQLAESEPVLEGLQRLPFLEQRGAQGVEIGCLGRPQMRFAYPQAGTIPPGNLLPTGIKYFVHHRSSLVCMLDLGFNRHLASVLRADGQVSEMGSGHGHQRDVAEDATGCPVVVVVEIAAPEL